MFPSIIAMSRGAPTSTAPPHQDGRRASKLLSRIREVVDRNRRYVSHSKANEGICELAPRVFPVQKFQHKVSLVQLLTSVIFCPRRVDFEIREERDRDDFQATDAMRPFSQRRRRRTRRTKTRPPRLDAPAAPLQEDWRARHGDLPSRPLNWDCEKRARERPPAAKVRLGISPAW